MAKYKLNLNLSDGTSVTTSNAIDIPSISANPSSTTTTLTGLTINGTNYAVEGKKFTNVSASYWVSSSTYSGYSYQCTLICSGITSSSFVEVVFAPTEADSGNYAPVCSSGNNTVTIYSKVNTTITIPTIKEVK